MATAATLIDRAMRLIGQVASGATSAVSEYADGLTALNALLSRWNNERLMCYTLQEETLSFTAAVSRTIGPSGNLVTVRPLEILQAWVVNSNTSYDVQLISDEEYGALPDKTSTATWPSRANYKPSMPDGTIYFYPVPSAAGTMKLLTRTMLSAFAAITDTVTLPPGWEDALAFNLAVMLAPEFEREASATVQQMAVEAKADIKRANRRPIKAYTELPELFGRRRGNIFSNLP